MGYRIKEVSGITGISVRMLRYYDRKGLLEPGIDKNNGYRDYSRKDIEKLGRIMVLKELDFTVGEMKSILEGDDEDCKGLFRGQLELLREKRDRLDGISNAGRKGGQGPQRIIQGGRKHV